MIGSHGTTCGCGLSGLSGMGASGALKQSLGGMGASGALKSSLGGNMSYGAQADSDIISLVPGPELRDIIMASQVKWAEDNPRVMDTSVAHEKLSRLEQALDSVDPENQHHMMQAAKPHLLSYDYAIGFAKAYADQTGLHVQNIYEVEVEARDLEAAEAQAKQAKQEAEQAASQAQADAAKAKQTGKQSDIDKAKKSSALADAKKTEALKAEETKQAQGKALESAKKGDKGGVIAAKQEVEQKLEEKRVATHKANVIQSTMGTPTKSEIPTWAMVVGGLLLLKLVTK